jgi:subtilisin family serine protease
MLFPQSLYRYQGSKIDLRIDTTLYFIQTKEDLAESLNSILETKIQVGEIPAFQRISLNRFLIAGKIPKDRSNDYFSSLYRDNENEYIIILPRIGLSLKRGSTLLPILEKFEGKLRIESESKQHYILICDVSNSEEMLKIAEDLSNENDILWCEPEFLSEYRYANPLYPYQYYLRNTGQFSGTVGIDINVSPAWNITNGSPCITVAVIDAGVERNHEDLGGRVLEGFTIDNPTGLGEPQNENDLDPKAHGMACAGIIAASNNTLGIRGIASNINILPVNIVPDPYTIINGVTITGFGTNIEIAQAIDWASDRADILSCSWGGTYFSIEISDAIDRARTFGRNDLGSVVVCASGNNWPDASDISFPANLDGVISVGAIDNKGLIWGYSQRGTSLDLVAPSGDISLAGNVRTTDRMDEAGYNTGNYMPNFGGTSAACPQVAGVAALVLSVKPDISEAQVTTILQQTATDMGSSGFDITYGYGRVNAYAAIQTVSPTITGPSIVCNTNSTFTISGYPPGATCTWAFSSGLVTPNSGSGTSAVFHGTSCSVIGEGNLTFTVNIPDCGQFYVTKKDIVINGPDYSDVYISVLDSYGQTLPQQSLLCPYTVYHIYVHNNSICSTSNYTWDIPSGWTLNYSYNNMVSINTNDSPWGNVIVKAQTCCTGCGSNVAIHSAYFSEGYECGQDLFTIFPNPSSSYVDIDLNKEIQMDGLNLKQDRVYDLSVINTSGVVKFATKLNGLPYRLNTATLQDGTYIVKISYEGKTWSSRLMIKH